jgi:hypothetical protein
MLFKVQLKRVREDFLTVEVEADSEQQAKRKALRGNEATLESERWCDGHYVNRKVVKVWPAYMP